MPDMLDPGLEHLHRHGRLWRMSKARRRLVSEAVIDGLMLIPLVLLFIFASEGSWAPPLVVIGLVLAGAAASLVRFDIVSGSTSPMHIVQVPLWYAVPPAWIPVMVAISLVLGGFLEELRSEERQGFRWKLISAGDALPMVGPATVYAVTGVSTATPDGWWVFAAAFFAEAALSLAITFAASWMVHGLRPNITGRFLLWVTAVDGALAPIGFIGAIVIEQNPIALLGLIPLVAVLGEFARERTDRLEQAFQLSNAYRGTAQLMGDVLEADDAYTGGEHTQGVVEMAVAVGAQLGLGPADMRDVEFGALLHDVGKLRIPNAIINKPGSLTDEEWAVVRQHPVFGQEMLERVGGALARAGRVVRAHHERWDGGGYPDGLRGEQIPVAARIVTVCDSYSAMTTARSYSTGRTQDDALAELRRCSATQFDPSVVDALHTVLVDQPELICRGTGGQYSEDASPAVLSLGLRPIA